MRWAPVDAQAHMPLKHVDLTRAPLPGGGWVGGGRAMGRRLHQTGVGRVALVTLHGQQAFCEGNGVAHSQHRHLLVWQPRQLRCSGDAVSTLSQTTTSADDVDHSRHCLASSPCARRAELQVMKLILSVFELFDIALEVKITADDMQCVLRGRYLLHWSKIIMQSATQPLPMRLPQTMTAAPVVVHQEAVRHAGSAAALPACRGISGPVRVGPAHGG